jgi:hypothetical protein
MSDERARELIRAADRLKQDRSTFERHWQDIADVMRPTVHPFVGNATPTPGEKRTQKIFDSVPPMALEKHGAVLEALLSPRNQVWSKLATTDEELQDDIEVQRYLEQVNKVLFRVRYRPQSNLASQLSESYLNLGSFGTQVLYVGDDVGSSIIYRSCGLHNVVIDEDEHGRVNAVHRWYDYNAEQAMRAFLGPQPSRDAVRAVPLFSRMPVALRNAYEQRSPQKFRFLHSVVPRDTVESDRRDYRGMRFASFHSLVSDSSLITESGFRVMPYCVSRYTKSSDELYGRSPAMLALPDTNTLNRMTKTVVRGGEKVVDPPLLTIDDSLAPFNLNAGAMNYGTLDEQGRELIKAFNSGARLDLGLELMAQKRATIQEAFLLNVFQILADHPQMTATQVLELAKEKAALLSPIMGRQQSELFGPMTERELDILTAANLLPPMPDALIEADGEVTVEYQSPLALAQRAETGASILRTWEAITPLAQTPEGAEAMRVFKVQESMLELARINGYPAKGLRTKDEITALDEEAAQEAQAQQLLAAAPVVAQSLDSLASAQQKAASGG